MHPLATGECALSLSLSLAVFSPPNTRRKAIAMDEYAREMMDLKTLVTRTLEKRGVLARIRAELRANVFAAIEEEDRAVENDENPTFALLGSCNQRAKELHASPTGKLLTALICDYLEWCQLEHTLKVYLPECNLPRGFWKSELKEKLGQKADMGASKDEEHLPVLVDIVESYLKLEQQNTASSLTGNFTKLAVRRTPPESASLPAASDDSQANLDKANSTRRSSSASLTGSLPPLGRKGGLMPIGQTRNFMAPLGTASDHGVTEELDGELGWCEPWPALNEKRILTTNTDPIETNGDLNNNNGSSSDAQLDGNLLNKRPEDVLSVEDVLPSEKTSEGSQIENRNQHLNSFWRQSTSVALYDDASLESLEEVVEEEDASFEKESCSSA